MIARVAAPDRHGYLPVPADADSKPFWDGLAAGRLTLPRCTGCGRVWAPPAPRCPHCAAPDPSWVELAGTGRLYSWIVVHRAMDEAFADDVPFTLAVVTLDGADGARLVGRLLDADPPTVRIDLPVRVVAYPVRDQTLPGFVPDRDP